MKRSGTQESRIEKDNYTGFRLSISILASPNWLNEGPVGQNVSKMASLNQQGKTFSKSEIY